MDVIKDKVEANETVTGDTPTKFHRDLAPHRHVSMRVCKRCGKMFVLSDKDALYFFENFKTLPLKCEDCRKKSRMANDAKNGDVSN